MEELRASATGGDELDSSLAAKVVSWVRTPAWKSSICCFTTAMPLFIEESTVARPWWGHAGIGLCRAPNKYAKTNIVNF